MILAFDPLGYALICLRRGIVLSLALAFAVQYARAQTPFEKEQIDRLLDQSQLVDLRVGAAEQLGQSYSPARHKALEQVALSADNDSKIRVAAVKALSKWPGETNSTLLKALDDKDPGVRAEALSEVVVPMSQVAQLLAASQPVAIRFAAARRLAVESERVGSQNLPTFQAEVAKPALAALKLETDSDTLRQLTNLLPMLGEEDALQAAIEFVGSNRAANMRRQAARSVLNYTRKETIVASVLSLINRENDPGVLSELLYALNSWISQTGSPEVLEAVSPDLRAKTAMRVSRVLAEPAVFGAATPAAYSAPIDLVGRFTNMPTYSPRGLVVPKVAASLSASQRTEVRQSLLQAIDAAQARSKNRDDQLVAIQFALQLQVANAAFLSKAGALLRPGLENVKQTPNVLITAGQLVADMELGKDKDDLQALREFYKGLNGWLESFSGKEAELNRTAGYPIEQHAKSLLKEVGRKADSIEGHKTIAQRIWAIALQWPVSTLVLVAYSVWMCLLACIYTVRPTALPHLNQFLRSLEVPVLGIKIPLRWALLVAPLWSTPRVLDAWVAERIPAARDRFLAYETVSHRRIHIPVPVELDGKVITEVGAKDFQGIFSRATTLLLIEGEGGSGKTSLACFIATLAMLDSSHARVSPHRMLPVLMEHEVLVPGAGRSSFLETVRRRLQDLTGEAQPSDTDLVIALLVQRRILVIVDHYSELSDDSRARLSPLSSEFIASAAILTSRQRENLGVSASRLKPLRIAGQRLSSFMESYLRQQGVRDHFTDPEFFRACERLSNIVGDRDITVLLAKLFAEYTISEKEARLITELQSETIPDLMLAYLNQINAGLPEREAFPDEAIQFSAKVTAWECLKGSLKPDWAPIDAVIPALEERYEDPRERLTYLEKRMRLLQRELPRNERIRFVLDPIAEYLAAEHLCATLSSEGWTALINRIASAFHDHDRTPGFVFALHDCLSTGRYVVPMFVKEAIANFSRRNVTSKDVTILATHQ